MLDYLKSLFGTLGTCISILMYTSLKSVEDAHELFYLSHMRVSNDQTTQGIQSLVRAFTAGSHKTETFEFVIVQLYGDTLAESITL